MIKRILVPTDGSEAAELGVRYAVALAKRSGATLCGIHVVDIKLLEGPFLRDLSASLGTAPYVNYQGNISMILEERGKSALSAFSEVCATAGVPCETRQVTGIVPNSIVEQGGLADLTVIGRSGEHNEWLEGLMGSTTEAVVRRASQPVIVTATERFGAERLLAAYDGSSYARKALKLAAGLAGEWAASLHVLCVGAQSATHCEEARGYLQAHPLEATYAVREGKSSETIVAYAEEVKADLLLMGAYGHSKVHELILGSTTTYAINHAPCPALLAR